MTVTPQAAPAFRAALLLPAEDLTPDSPLPPPSSPRAGLDGARRDLLHSYIGLGAFTAVFALPPLLLVNWIYFSTLVFALILATVAVSLDLLLGFAGQLALGQVALFATGSYVSAILTTRYHVRPELALLAAVGAGMAVALATSPILRLRGFYFALATLALVLIAAQVSTNWLTMTGGSSGLVGIQPFSLFGTTLRTQKSYYLFAYVVLLLAVVAGVHVRRSRFGRALLAIHHDPIAAEALGVSVWWTKTRVWLLSSALAALAGVVYADYIQFLSPAQFGLDLDVMLLAAVVIGGVGSIYGGVVGVVVLELLPKLFAGLQNEATLAYGVAVVACMVVMPGGIVGAAFGLVGRVRRHSIWRARASTDVETVR